MFILCPHCYNIHQINDDESIFCKHCYRAFNIIDAYFVNTPPIIKGDTVHVSFQKKKAKVNDIKKCFRCPAYVFNENFCCLSQYVKGLNTSDSCSLTKKQISNLIEEMTKDEQKEYKYAVCSHCGKILKDKESILRGIGKQCLIKYSPKSKSLLWED